MSEFKHVLFPPVKKKTRLYFKTQPSLIDGLAIVSQLDNSHIERRGNEVIIVIDGTEN